MASRRLAISSLLCEDEPQDVSDSSPQDDESHAPLTLTPQCLSRRRRTPSPPLTSTSSSGSPLYYSGSYEESHLPAPSTQNINNTVQQSYNQQGPPYATFSRSSSSLPPYSARSPSSHSSLPPPIAIPTDNYHVTPVSPSRSSMSPSVAFHQDSHRPSQTYPPTRHHALSRPLQSPHSAGTAGIGNSRLYHAVRPSPIITSLSPSVSQAAPYSGLEALVQAATEERERIGIDVSFDSGGSRQPVGGDRPSSYSPSNVRASRSMSPVMLRGDASYHGASSPQLQQPKSPYAYTHPTSYWEGSRGQSQHRVHDPEEGVRPWKRRRSTPEHEPKHEHGRHSPLRDDYGHGFEHTYSLPHTHRQRPHTITHTPLSPSSAPPRSASEGNGDTPPTDLLPTPVAMPVPISATSPLSARSLARAISASSSSFNGRTKSARNKLSTGKLPGPMHAEFRMDDSEAGVITTGDSDAKATVKVDGHLYIPREPILDQSTGSFSSTLERMGLIKRMSVTVEAESKRKNEDTKGKERSPWERMEEEGKYKEEEEEDDVDEFFCAVFGVVSPKRPDGKTFSLRNSGSKKGSESATKVKTKKARSKVHDFSSSPVLGPPKLQTTIYKSRTPTPVSALEHALGMTSSPPRSVTEMPPESRSSTALVVATEHTMLVAASSDTDEINRLVSDGEDASAMEIDVEDELLSLVDDRPRTSSRSHPSPLPSSTQDPAPKDLDVPFPFLGYPSSGKGAPALRETSLMPPPVKRGLAKTGSTSAIENSALKAFKSRAAGAQVTTAKAPKAKMLPKGRSKQGSKAKKQVKDAQSHAQLPATLHPSLPTPPDGTIGSARSSAGPSSEPFPNVTSSGRMVTKSKKSAAAVGTGPGLTKARASPFSTPLAPVTAQKKRSSTVGAEVGETRSRSQSVLARDSIDPEGQKGGKGDETENLDVEEDSDKLYCVCKTKYDEDRVMIACDRCDEWYHTQCVNMPDLEVDLVDQFVCPPCIDRNPNLPLQTTYKQRCLTGLLHADPASSDACHKPARGAFSKYCSDECGILYMQAKIQAWAGKGGDVTRLWVSLKGAKRREGVVVGEPVRTWPKKIDAAIKGEEPVGKWTVELNGALAASDTGEKREIGLLQIQLDNVMRDREARKKRIEVITWRERLLQLATERAERLADECGWDQRLCFGDEEWADFGEGVLESYEEDSASNRSTNHDARGEDDEGTPVDGQTEEGEWWCRGKKKCERHVGWQKLRMTEITFEKELEEVALAKLTTREREVRKRLEDIVDLRHRMRSVVSSKFLLKAKVSKATANGTLTRKPTDGIEKKGKKKKPTT